MHRINTKNMRTPLKFVFILFVNFFSVSCSNNHPKENKLNVFTDEDIKRIKIENELKIIKEEKKITCTEENAKTNFLSWMDFKFPDWPIKSEIKIKKSGDCHYDIRFKTRNPHLQFSATDEIIVVRIYFFDNYQRYNVDLIRGVLY